MKNHEIRIKCDLELHRELKEICKNVLSLSLQDGSLSILELGLQNLRSNLNNNKILKIEFVPSKSIKRIYFETTKEKLNAKIQLNEEESE